MGQHSIVAELTGKAQFDIAVAYLRESPLRVTKARLALLRYFAGRRLPATIAETHRAIGVRTCDVVTLYRSLEKLERIKLVRRLFRFDGVVLFTLALPEPDYFAVSTSDGSAERISFYDTVTLRTAILGIERQLRARGYADVFHSVQFFVRP